MVASCLLLAGCTGTGGVFGTGEPEVDQAALEERVQSVDSYEVEVTRTLQSHTINETTTIDGVVDAEERRAHLTQTTETSLSTEPRITEQYVLGDDRYTNGDDGWESDDGSWDGVDRLEAVPETFENATFERIRTETVDGTETTMFEVEVPDDRETEVAGISDSAHVSASVEELLYYVLVDTETDTIYGTDLRMQVSQGGEPALITVETTFTDHNGVDVSVPDDVTEAAD